MKFTAELQDLRLLKQTVSHRSLDVQTRHFLVTSAAQSDVLLLTLADIRLPEGKLPSILIDPSINAAFIFVLFSSLLMEEKKNQVDIPSM